MPTGQKRIAKEIAMSKEMEEAQETPEPQEAEKPEAKAPNPQQVEIDRIVQERLQRERDKHKAQLEELEVARAKAAKYDEIEEANKSELEKAVARAEEAEKKAADEAKARVRAEVSATSEVPVKFLQFDLPKEELEGLAQELNDWRNSREKQMPHTPALPENTPPEPTGDLEAQITEAEKAGNHLLAIQLRQQLATKKSEKP